MVLNKRTVFLVDGIGAAASAIFSGQILPMFAETLGLSVGVLCLLALLACVFMSYSLACYFLGKTFKPWMLIAIILANILYCLVSLGLIAFYDPITTWGIAVLSAEIFVVLLVVFLEYKTLRQNT